MSFNLDNRDKEKCFYCGDVFKLTGGRLPSGKPRYNNSMDHIIPLSRGGNNLAVNKVQCCTRCNVFKSGRIPEEFSGFIIKILSGEHKIRKKARPTDDELRFILSRNRHIIEQIAPYRKELYKPHLPDALSEFHEKEKSFSEMLKNHTQMAKHVKNTEHEVTKKKKIHINYKSEDWY